MRPHKKDMTRDDAALDCFNELLQGELPDMLTRSTVMFFCVLDDAELHSSLLVREVVDTRRVSSCVCFSFPSFLAHHVLNYCGGRLKQTSSTNYN